MERMTKGEGMTPEEYIAKIEEENKELKEFKTKREESMFYFKAQMERAEPKTAREAEDLQKAKEMFEGLYREELSCLEEENRKLKEWAEENSYLRAKLRKTEGELEIAKKERDEYKERRERSFSV